MQTIALFFLATVAVGGVAWVFVYPILSGERKAEKRMASVASTEPAARTTEPRQPEIPTRRRSRAPSRKSTQSAKKQQAAAAQITHRAGRPVVVEAAIPDRSRPRSARSSFIVV